MTKLTRLQKKCNVGHEREISQWTNLLEWGVVHPPPSRNKVQAPLSKGFILGFETVGEF